jgi:hypothetical protein
LPHITIAGLLGTAKKSRKVMTLIAKSVVTASSNRRMTNLAMRDHCLT